MYSFTNLQKCSPVKERLTAFTFKPNIIVEVQIVSIAMAWINLLKIQEKSHQRSLFMQRFNKNKVNKFSKRLTASSQC